MAKSKNKTSLILSIVAIALCLLTAITFFLPTVKAKDEDASYIKFSAMEICFNSAESASEKAKEELKAGNTEQFSKYTALASFKENEDTAPAFNAAGWMQFIAMVASVVAIVLIVLAMLGKKVGLIATIAVLAALAFMIAGLISTISFLNVEIVGKAVSESVKVGAGLIVGLISSVLAAVSVFIKVNGKKAV